MFRNHGRTTSSYLTLLYNVDEPEKRKGASWNGNPFQLAPPKIYWTFSAASFASGGLPSTFGNIYAGSMNGIFEWDTEITVNNVGNAKKINIGAIHASGAHEADSGGMFDTIEPQAPEADPVAFYTFGDVAVHLMNNAISVDGTNATTSVTTSTVYPSNIPLKNVHRLTIEAGTITPVYADAATTLVTIPYVTVKKDATLDLTRAGNEPTIEHYDGAGTVTVKKDGTLHILTSMSGQMRLQAEGAFNGQSGTVIPDHVYVKTPNEQATITFEPNASQSHVALVKQWSGNVVEWKISDEKQPVSHPSLIGFTITPEDATQTKRYKELHVPNSDGTIRYEPVEIPFQVQVAGDAEVYLENYPIEITVNGKKATYRADDVSYYADHLNMMMYFTSDGVNHYLMIEGQTNDGQPTEIAVGSYAFHVSYVKEDGTVAEFTANVTVTDESKTGTSAIQFGAVNSLKFGDTVTIPVSITHDSQAVGAVKVYLHVNDQQIAEQDVAAADQLHVQFEDVALTTANNFNVGNNALTVTYSGTDMVNGSRATQVLEVAKALPVLTLHPLQPAYEYDYDGTAKPLAASVPSKVVVTVAGETVSNHEEKILYKNTAQANAAFTEELPMLPGVYETKMIVSEGPSYERAEIAGPMLTINRVKPTVNVTGEVKDGALTLTAHVSSAANAMVPNGVVEFYVNGVPLATANVVNGIATYTTSDSGAITTYNVKAKYTDETMMDGQTGTSLYEAAESAPIQIHVADTTVKVAGVALDENVLHVTVDEVAKLNAVVNPINATNAAVVWYIDNAAIASISQDGTITALSAGTATITVTTVDGGHEATAVVHVKEKAAPPIESGGGEPTPQPPAENGGGEPVPQPPTENGVGEQAPQPPVENGSGVQAPQPPVENGGGVQAPQPPIENGVGEQAPQPPVENGGGAPIQPPVETEEVPVLKPPTASQKKPSSSGGGGGGGGGSKRPNATAAASANNDANAVDETTNAENTFTVDVEGLDEQLQAKVDSLIANVVAQSEQEFKLSLGGEAEDLRHVTDVVINEKGIFITVDGKQINVTDKVPVTIDFTNARAVRYVNNQMSAVMHMANAEGLRITSSQLHDVIITTKVQEPFEDVAADAWYQQYVEALYNYSFTQGTTATTYAPNSEMTRAQFAVMIARALEMSGVQAASTYTLADVEGKWYANDIQRLVDLGIITGYADGSFKGNDPLTRQQAVTMLARALQILGVDISSAVDANFEDVSAISAYAQNAVNFFANNGVLVSGEGVSFNPHDNLTRAQMAKILIEGLRLSGKY